jgi:hypothetical protein
VRLLDGARVPGTRIGGENDETVKMEVMRRRAAATSMRAVSDPRHHWAWDLLKPRLRLRRGMQTRNDVGAAAATVEIGIGSVIAIAPGNETTSATAETTVAVEDLTGSVFGQVVMKVDRAREAVEGSAWEARPSVLDGAVD